MVLIYFTGYFKGGFEGPVKVGYQKKKKKHLMNQKTKSLHTDSKHLECLMRKYGCVAMFTCVPLWREELGTPHGLHIWVEGGHTQGEVRNCFAFPPRK